MIVIKISDSKTLSRVIVSTLSVWTAKVFSRTPLRLEYDRLLKTVKETGTTVITKSITRHPRKGQPLFHAILLHGNI